MQILGLYYPPNDILLFDIEIMEDLTNIADGGAYVYSSMGSVEEYWCKKLIQKRGSIPASIYKLFLTPF